MILGPSQFEYEMNIRKTRRRVLGTNTYKEHLQYKEKEQNIKNIVFDPFQLFDRCQSFIEPCYPRYSRQKFDPRYFFLTHAKILWTDATHATHAKFSVHAVFFDPRQKLLNQCHRRTHTTHASQAI